MLLALSPSAGQYDKTSGPNTDIDRSFSIVLDLDQSQQGKHQCRSIDIDRYGLHLHFFCYNGCLFSWHLTVRALVCNDPATWLRVHRPRRRPLHWLLPTYRGAYPQGALRGQRALRVLGEAGGRVRPDHSGQHDTVVVQSLTLRASCVTHPITYTTHYGQLDHADTSLFLVGFTSTSTWSLHLTQYHLIWSLDQREILLSSALVWSFHLKRHGSIWSSVPNRRPRIIHVSMVN